MKIPGDAKKRRDEIVKKLDFLSDLQKAVNIKQDVEIEVKLLSDEPNEQDIFSAREIRHSTMAEEIKDILEKENDAQTIIDELMQMQKEGAEFTYGEAHSVLSLPVIEKFKEENKQTKESVVKTRIIKALYQKDLGEATKTIVDLIYKADDDAARVIASTLNSFGAEASLRRRIINELNKDERLERRIILFFSEELFKDIDISDGKRVKVENGISSKELDFNESDEHDDLDVQKDINILRDSGIDALMTYLGENDIDERSFNIGDLKEIVESFKDVTVIKYLDFINKLERIAMGEIKDDMHNKEEFKSEYIDVKAAKNDIYVVRLYEQIGNKYYITCDMAREILNLPSIETYRHYQKLLRQNIDKIRIRAQLESVEPDEENKILIDLIRGKGLVKLESVLKELVLYTQEMSGDIEAEEVYNEANKRCGELFLAKKDEIKDLIKEMNKNLSKNNKNKGITQKDIDDMFESDDNNATNSIIKELRGYYEQNGIKQAKYALAEINYMERIGNLLNEFEINLTIPRMREEVIDLSYEEDKNKQAIGLVKLILGAGQEKKIEDALLFELMDFNMDKKLQQKIDILLEKARDDKKITTQEYMKWVKNISKLHKYQYEKGMEI